MPYLNLLSNDERQLLLNELELHASDDILLSAVAEAKAARQRMSSDLAEFKKQRNKGTPTLLTQSKDTEAKIVVELESAPTKKVYVEPPNESAARVLSTTTEIIIGVLNASDGVVLAEINKQLKSTLDNTERVLKLLWKRKLVLYDGERYFIA